jgi:hypothetical protein
VVLCAGEVLCCPEGVDACPMPWPVADWLLVEEGTVAWLDPLCPGFDCPDGYCTANAPSANRNVPRKAAALSVFIVYDLLRFLADECCSDLRCRLCGAGGQPMGSYSRI